MKTKLSKKILGIALALVMLMTLVPMSALTAFADGDKPDPVWPDEGAINRTKTGRPLTDQEAGNRYDPKSSFEVKLTVEGKNIEPDYDVNVFMLLDNSTSMNGTPLSSLKTAARAFVDILLPDESSVANLNYLTFGTEASNFAGPYTYETRNTLKNAITNIPSSGGFTNTQMALKKANAAVSAANAKAAAAGRTAKNYVVLFSDGVPTVSYKAKNVTTDHDFVSAGGIPVHTHRLTGFTYNDTNRIVGGTGGSYYLYNSNSQYWVDNTNVIDHGQPTISEAYILKGNASQVYTISLGGTLGRQAYVLRNCASNDSSALTTNVERMKAVFEQIAAEILYAAKEAVVTDPMGTWDFDAGNQGVLMFEPIWDAQFPVKVNGQTVTVIKDPAPGYVLQEGEVAYNTTTNTWTWNIGTVKGGQTNAATLSYFCKATQEGLDLHNKYYPDSSTTQYPLNNPTYIDYLNVYGDESQKEFEVPRTVLPNDRSTIDIVFFLVNEDGKLLGGQDGQMELIDSEQDRPDLAKQIAKQAAVNDSGDGLNGIGLFCRDKEYSIDMPTVPTGYIHFDGTMYKGEYPNPATITPENSNEIVYFPVYKVDDTDVTVVYFEGPVPENLTWENYDPADKPANQIGTHLLADQEQGTLLADLAAPVDADTEPLLTDLDEGKPGQGFSRTGTVDTAASIVTMGADGTKNYVFVSFLKDPTKYVTVEYNVDKMNGTAPASQEIFNNTTLKANGLTLSDTFVEGTTTATDADGRVWTFRGWRTAKQGGGAKFSDETTVTAGTDGKYTVYAKWDTDYTVTYLVDPATGTHLILTSTGGSVAPDGKKVTFEVNQVWGAATKSVSTAAPAPGTQIAGSTPPCYFNYWEDDYVNTTKMPEWTWNIVINKDLTFMGFCAEYGQATFTFLTEDAAAGKILNADSEPKDAVTQTEYTNVPFNGGKVPMPEPAPGYAAVGWQELKDNDAEAGVWENISTWPTRYDKDRTFRIRFEKQTTDWVTVTFNPQGGSFPDDTTASKTATVLKGYSLEGADSFAAYAESKKAEWPEWYAALADYTVPADSALTDYAFGGWFSEASSAGTLFDATEKVNADKTVHTRYTKTATITFIAMDGGSFEGGQTTVSYPGTVTRYSTTSIARSAFPATPNRVETDGRTFSHWESPIGTWTIVPGAGRPYDEDATYYARFTTLYTLHYEVGSPYGAVSGMPADEYLAEGQYYTLANAPTATAGAFVRWELVSGNPTQNPMDNSYNMPASNVTYRAVWTNSLAARVNYTCNLDGGREAYLPDADTQVGLGTYDVRSGLARPSNGPNSYGLQSVTVAWQKYPSLSVMWIEQGDVNTQDVEPVRVDGNAIPMGPADTLFGKAPGIAEEVLTASRGAEVLSWCTWDSENGFNEFDPNTATITADTTVYAVVQFPSRKMTAETLPQAEPATEPTEPVTEPTEPVTEPDAGAQILEPTALKAGLATAGYTLRATATHGVSGNSGSVVVNQGENFNFVEGYSYTISFVYNRTVAPALLNYAVNFYAESTDGTFLGTVNTFGAVQQNTDVAANVNSVLNNYRGAANNLGNGLNYTADGAVQNSTVVRTNNHTINVVYTGTAPVAVIVPVVSPAGGGGGAVAPVAPDPVAPVEDPPTPEAPAPDPDPETTPAPEPVTPEAQAAGAWALLNRIIAILALLMAIVLIVGIFSRRKRKQAEETEEQAKLRAERIANGEEAEEPEDNKGKPGLVWRVLAIIAGVLSHIVFLFTENIRLPMTFVDRWTLLMVILLAVQLILMLILRKARQAKDQDDEERQKPAQA